MLTDQELLKLLKIFCAEYDVQKDDLLSSKRGNLVPIRKAISIRLRKNGWSYPLIGKLLNRHHTTIMHLVGAR